ncbi:MAG: monooxygenase, partial [Actinomycetota bacterium]|nr:monooxygenase [Actinomycetota bacterium]
RRAMGLEQPSPGPRRWGIRRHVQIAPWTDSVEVHWAPGAEAYVTPVADDCVGIAILSSSRGGFDRHFEEFPELRARVQGHARGPDRAAGPLRQTARSRTAGRVLLVGDAAGYVDALTGEGMGLAFAAASQLVQCVVADRPADYDRQWRRATRRYRILTTALVRAGVLAPVRARIVPAATALPRVFALAVNQLAY